MIQDHRLRTVTILFLFLFSPSLVLATGFLTGLSSHFSFDEGTGGATVNAFNLTLNATSNTPRWDTGIIGYGLEFRNVTNRFSWSPDDDRVSECGTTVQNNSMSVWVKPYNLLSNGYDRAITTCSTGRVKSLFITYQGYIGVYDTSYSPNGVLWTDRIVPAGEWSHIVLTKDVGVYHLYINGQEATNDVTYTPTFGGTPYSNSFIFGGYYSSGTLTRDVFNGTIDQYDYWKNRTLTAEEVNTLYNGGYSIDFTAYSMSTPIQTASFAPIEMGFLDSYEFFVNSYFDDYQSMYISFSDGLSSAYLPATVGGTEINYSTTTLKARVTPIGDDVRVRFQSNQTIAAFPITVYVANGAGYTSDIIDFSIGGGVTTTDAPSQLGSFNSPIILGQNQTYYIDLNGIFTDYTDVNLTFVDNVAGSSQRIHVNKTTNLTVYNTTHGDIGAVGTGTSTKIYLHSDTEYFETDITVTAYSQYGKVSDSFTIRYDPDFGIITGYPPQAILSPYTITVNGGRNYVIRASSYFTNFTSFTFMFDDLIEHDTVQIGPNTAYQHDYFNITGNSEGFTFYAGPLSYDQTFTLRASNQYGTSTAQIPIHINGGSFPTNTTTVQGAIGNTLSAFDNIFPDSEDLTLRQRMTYVFVIMLLIAIGIFAMTYSAGPGIAGILTLIVELFAFFYFTSIGYIPVVLIVLLTLIGVGIAYIMIKRGGG